jgi:hypothetical protein
MAQRGLGFLKAKDHHSGLCNNRRRVSCRLAECPMVCVELLIGDLRVRPIVTILRVKSKTLYASTMLISNEQLQLITLDHRDVTHSNQEGGWPRQMHSLDEQLLVIDQPIKRRHNPIKPVPTSSISLAFKNRPFSKYLHIIFATPLDM